MDAGPESSITLQVVLIVVLTLINAYFAASEMAIVSVNKNKIRRLSEEGNKGRTAYFGAINNAKFKKKVVPGDKLKLECHIIKRQGPVGIGSATATVDGKLAVSAELTFMIG